jgi:integrase/recombinase XerD
MNSLKQGVEEYLKDRCKAGFKMQDEKKVLSQFIFFLEKNGISHITTKLALAFATLNPQTSPERWAVRLRMVRQFAKYMSLEDPKTEIPPDNLLPYSYRRKAPYIYEDDDIIRLLKCDESGEPNDRFDQYTYFVLFGLLAVTGMRISEALNLKCNEVNFQDRVITILKSKFNKSRYIPIHKSTTEVLQNYSSYKSQCFPNQTSEFFIDRNGNAPKAARVRRVFRKRLKKIGIATSKEGRNARITDLRHTFVVKTFLNWYKHKVANIDILIPVVSTYLGHSKPSKTYWYLTATPQLWTYVTARSKSIKRGK